MTAQCSYTYHLPDLEYRPKCENDGTFAAKQCKGDMIYGRYQCQSGNYLRFVKPD